MEEGQVWEMKDSNLRIGIVGKRLVHYKHFKQGTKRANHSLISIPVLEKYLQEHQALLARHEGTKLKQASAR